MKQKDARICIIGAGAAGLSAAYFLKRRGYRNITILERSERVGGKCHSIDYHGRSFDLGANYVTAAYSEVLELARSHRAILYTESPVSVGHILASGDIAFATPFVAISRKSGSFRIAMAMIRYIWARLRIRSIIDRPGFRLISKHGDLCTSFQMWLRANKLSALEPMFEVPITIMGYGYLDEIPAPYALKYLGLATYFNLIAVALGLPTRWPKRFVKGFERLWDEIASQLDVRLNTDVALVSRNESIHVQLKDRAAMEFDYLILACPLEPKTLSRFLTLSDLERELFSQVTWNKYVVITYDIPELHLPKRVIGMLPVPEPNYPWAITRQFDDNAFVQFYTRLDTSRRSSEEEVIEGVRRFVAAFGASLPERYITYNEWNYFPHVTAQQVRNGFYDRLEALQGSANTFYCGGIVAFESVETVVQYSRRLVECYF